MAVVYDSTQSRQADLPAFKGQLISSGQNAKTRKGDGREFVTAILYLAPWRLVEGFNACPNAELAACHGPCLNLAGRGPMDSVQAGRARKTRLLRDDPDRFLAILVADLERFEPWAHGKGLSPVVRLNGTSDLRYERIPVWRNGVKFRNVFEAFPGIEFYDYTKLTNRRIPATTRNYHLTLSYSGANPVYARRVFDAAKRQGLGLAVVFRNRDAIPATWRGLPVVDGDKDDLRITDPAGPVCVALVAKGPAKRDQSGFVQD